MAQSELTGMFIPTTDVWETSEIYSMDVNSPQFKDLLLILYRNVNQIALALNVKETGFFNTLEYVCGQLYFPNPAYDSTTTTKPTFRSVFRKVINFGALPNTATKSVAHGIDPTPLGANVTFTRIYGASSDTAAKSYIPLPYASAVLVNNIELYVDGTNVNVTTAANWSTYTVTYIVLEYLKT